MDKERKRVAVLIESTRTYARELIRGIGQYNREHQEWIIEYVPRGLDDPPPLWLKNWKGDGILARINDNHLLETILELKLPTIDLRRNIITPSIPNIGPNDQEVVKLLYQHFREHGFFSFGYFGYHFYTNRSMDYRFSCFQQLMEKEDLKYTSLFLGTDTKLSKLNNHQLTRLRKWIDNLPERTAIITCNDDTAFHLLQACRAVGIKVPQQIAVAGIGNDECLCTLGYPTLTSVDLDPQRIGYQAADLLSRMMNEHYVPEQSIMMPPRGVVVRESTDIIATADQKLSDALQFIRENACRGITPGEVLKHVHLSRMALEIRFKSVLNQTIHEVIIQVRLRHVCELLATTDMTYRQIATETGFNYPEYLMRLFRQNMGITLKEYRNKYYK